MTEPTHTTTTSDRARIALRRSYATITPDQIVVKPARSALIGPGIQGGLTVLAALAIGLGINSLPMWLLGVLLVFVMLAGPTAVMGLAYNVMGSSFLMERKKGTCRWQQGFLGLGLGTRELAPFPRIHHFEVSGDFDDELNSGDLQDLVTWEVRLIKDNGRALDIASISTARALADEALERVNDLAIALGEMSGKPATLGAIPEWALEDYEDDVTDDLDADEIIEGDEGAED